MSPYNEPPMPAKVTTIKALAFDVGGSVFDWKSSIISVIDELTKKYELDDDIDPEKFAMSWRLLMFMTLGQLHKREIPNCNMDAMLKIALDKLLEQYPVLSLTHEDKADLLNAWHSMDVWDEFPVALERLKSKFTVSIISVLSMAIMVDSNKHSGLCWDAVISCEFLSCYKQKPEAYIEGAALLGLKPEEVCFVAVHPSDLLAAKKTGMKTAYVAPKGSEPDVPGLVMEYKPEDYDFNAATYIELCEQLGC